MQDSVVLANCLYELQSLDCADITAALQDFRDQRYPHVKEQYDASKMNAKIVYGQVSVEIVTQKVHAPAFDMED